MGEDVGHPFRGNQYETGATEVSSSVVHVTPRLDPSKMGVSLTRTAPAALTASDVSSMSKAEVRAHLESQVDYLKSLGFRQVTYDKKLDPSVVSHYMEVTAAARVAYDVKGVRFSVGLTVAFTREGGKYSSKGNNQWDEQGNMSKPGQVLKAGVYGEFHSEAKAIGFNVQLMYDKDSAREFQNGFKSTPHDSHTAYHELAHAAHFRSVGPTFDREWSGDVDRHVAGQVSRYARENPREFVAETLTGMMHGRTYPPDVMTLYERMGGPRFRRG